MEYSLYVEDMQSCCERLVPEPECLGMCVGSCSLWASPIMSQLVVNFESVCSPYIYVAKHCCISTHANKSSAFRNLQIYPHTSTKDTFKSSERTTSRSTTTTGDLFISIFYSIYPKQAVLNNTKNTNSNYISNNKPCFSQ